MVSRAKGSAGTMAQHCSQAKLWVKTHYERHEDGVVAKSVMYKHYEDYCREQGRNIMETSIFGRVVKSVFPDVTIRRLGGRDNLKYYYCGIQAKETSPYAIDNSTTTRPKRRLRKRELLTDKAEVHRCLLWLHRHYHVAPDASASKAEVYDRYAMDCASEPLSLQYFGMVVSHAFPQVGKRRLGTRASQQKFYFGIQERATPLHLDPVPPDLMRVVDYMFNNGRLCYREELDDEDEDEDDEEEDGSCRSPVSDTSEGSLRDALTPLSGGEVGAHYLSIKNEPVDYSLQHLKLKDEPLDDAYSVKDEPLDLHMPRDLEDEMDTSYMTGLQRSPSARTPAGGGSPSPSAKDQKTRKIYKPRFHIISDYDDGSWNSDAEKGFEDVQYCNNSVQSKWEAFLRNWLSQTFEEYERICVNRDQVYAYYEKYCELTGVTALPHTYFDETVLKVFRGVVTMIHPSDKTFYKGIRVCIHSDLYYQVEELVDGVPVIYQFVDEEATGLQRHSMELSPPAGAAPRISPLTLDDEEEAEEHYADNYRDAPDEELHSTPEVLRDGKYYLRMWLTDNFESVPDSCVLKADAYKHYEIYAKNIKQTPFEMNVFGKIVRQVFPKVTIRRLGGRVKPQYHYCGIAVKASSSLFQFMSGKDPAQRSRKKEIATDNKSAEIVIEWLRGSYEQATERIIMKGAVFSNYCSYCKSINENPVTLNYFGKLVKHCFPNVEVRKCGGRSEPNWYYFGLVPREEAGGQYLGPHHDLQEDMHQAESRHLGHGVPTNSTSPIPISLCKGEQGGAGGSHPANGSYSSASTMFQSQSVLLNQHVSLAQSPLLNPRSPFPGSPGDGVLEASYHRPPHDPCGASPTRSYREGLHSPEGRYLHEMRRQFVARSPYESGDVPSDNMFSHSPGDTSAQYCRSPRELLDSEGVMAAHSPAGDTSLIFSQSPLEANYPGGARPKAAGGGGVPLLQQQLLHRPDARQAHKRHKGHLQLGLDNYDMSDIKLE